MNAGGRRRKTRSTLSMQGHAALVCGRRRHRRPQWFFWTTIQAPGSSVGAWTMTAMATAAAALAAKKGATRGEDERGLGFVQGRGERPK